MESLDSISTENVSNVPKLNSTYRLGTIFKIKDYVDATNDASTRTRTVTIVLVIASVLIFIGFWNSFEWSWATTRLKSAYKKNYPEKFGMLKDNKNITLDPNDPEKFKEFLDTIDASKYEEVLQEQVVRAYIDNARFIKLPFFGIAVEVNDLGTIGGIALIIILLLMRFSLSREIKNLNLSFKEAIYHDQLRHFYHALAMRQVLTVPEMIGEEKNKLLANASKIVCILPAIVISIGVAYDYVSTFFFSVFKVKDVIFTHSIETICVILIWWLSIRCWERQSHIDSIWRGYWNGLDKKKSNIILIDEKTYKFFNCDNNAIEQVLREKTPKNEIKQDTAKKTSDESEKVRKSNVIFLDDDLVEYFGSDKVANDILKKHVNKMKKPTTETVKDEEVSKNE